MLNLIGYSRHAFLVAGVAALAACSESPTATDAAPEDAFLARAPAPTATPIAAIATAAGFDQLVGALAYVDAELEAGLVDLFLNGEDQYTVFAPTDEAFADLYGVLSAVLDTKIDEISDIPAEVVLGVLLYHVTEGRRAANSVVPKRNPRQITSLLGETFRVRGNLTIEDGLTGLRDDASILSADIAASNGIIHVIDGVIVPPSIVAALTS